MSDPNETTYDGLERRHNPMNTVTRADFEDFKKCVTEYRREAKQERVEMMRTVGKRLDTQDDTLNTITKALFYEPRGKNDPEPIGIVHVQRKIAAHVDVVCGIWKWLLVTVGAVLPIVAAFGQILHWW